MSNLVEHDLDPEEMEQEEDAFDSSSQGSSSQTSTITWINWYTSLPGHDYFCEVHEDFIDDDFNLTGLQSMVPFWKEALDMVLDVEPDEDFSKIPDVSIVENSAELLYGLVHQRFILTKIGLQAMADKYEMAHFGVCPRVFCQSAHVIPCGRADMPGVDTVKLACPNCGDIYTPPSSKYAGLDGAFFGTTFAPLFFQTYPELLSAPFCPAQSSSISSGSLAAAADSRASPAPSHPSTPGGPAAPHPVGGETYTNPNPHGGQRVADGRVYIPRIYGFKVSERARSGPRMRWLRERPERAGELDGVDWKGRFVSAGQGQGGLGQDVGEEAEALRNSRTSGSGDKGGEGGAGKVFGMGGAGEGKLFDDEDDDDKAVAVAASAPPPAPTTTKTKAKTKAAGTGGVDAPEPSAAGAASGPAPGKQGQGQERSQAGAGEPAEEESEEEEEEEETGQGKR